MRANGRFYKHFHKFFRRAGLPTGCLPARCHWPEAGAVTATVLSNENPEAVSAYYAQRMGLDTPEPAAAAAVESEPEKPAATEGASDAQQQEPIPEGGEQPPSKVHVRFSELTEKAKAADAAKVQALADLETERKARVLAEQQAAELRAKHEPPKADPLGPKPKLEQFNNADEFAIALEDWTTDKVTHERSQKDRMDRLAHQWGENEKAAKADIPDFEATIAAVADLTLPNGVRDAIMESDQGPWVLHHLAKNPELISQIRGMGADAQLRFIGKLEGKFEASRSSAPAASSAAKPATAAASEISRAPAPISPLRGSGSLTPDVPIDANGKFVGTAAQWRELRKAGKIK